MAHSLILGMTESGKTTLAKKLCEKYKKAGLGILVYDPLNDPQWQCDFKTSDVDEFLEAFWGSRSCAVFVDEAGDCAGQHDKIMQKTATRGRHWGHRVHYISQRGTMINRTIRDQCSHLFLFATALEDVKIHAKEWNKPLLLEAANFKQGDFFHCSRFGDLSQSNIFTGKSTHESDTTLDNANSGSDINDSSNNHSKQKTGVKQNALIPSKEKRASDGSENSDSA